ncbi:MAG TPA: hypothetical protein VFQ53_14190 [Kofleriaceae bacterium]|nr:hypothetical protein [Kofleriaceae bacterium]
MAAVDVTDVLRAPRLGTHRLDAPASFVCDGPGAASISPCATAQHHGDIAAVDFADIRRAPCLGITPSSGSPSSPHRLGRHRSCAVTASSISSISPTSLVCDGPGAASISPCATAQHHGDIAAIDFADILRAPRLGITPSSSSPSSPHRLG